MSAYVGVQQAEVWWATLPAPAGSAAAGRRPVLVVQGDAFNRSRIGTVVVVPLTTNLLRAGSPGNVRVAAKVSRLKVDSVANVSLVTAVDRGLLTERVGRVTPDVIDLVLDGIAVVLGR
jgi:mRNA interferase MazF